VNIAEWTANAHIKQATGNAESVRLQAMGEAEAIRATGQAKAEAYRAGVEAVGCQRHREDGHTEKHTPILTEIETQ
jgi:uncharacterized membrane protein YqiK